MSAPDHAYKLGPPLYEVKNGKDIPYLRKDQPKIRCTCGWKGRLEDLLGVDENNTMWCPQCRQWSGWIYA